MRTRAAAAALTGLAVALSLTGCAFITPQQTSVSYQPSDGVQGQVGSVLIRNAILFSSGGTAANLVTVLVNQGDSAATVGLQYDASGTPAQQSVLVPANSAVQIQPGASATVTLSPIEAKVGSLFDVSFVTGSSSTTLPVPVLNTTLPGYQGLAPTPGSGTPTPTASASPSATVSPTPLSTATPATTTPVPSDSPSS